MHSWSLLKDSWAKPCDRSIYEPSTFVYVTWLRSALMIYAFHKKSSMMSSLKWNFMSNIPVKSIMPKKTCSKASCTWNFLQRFLTGWICMKKKIRNETLLHFVLKLPHHITLDKMILVVVWINAKCLIPNRPLHSCYILLEQTTKLYKKRIVLRNFSQGVQAFLVRCIHGHRVS